jgi:hypothetical protein
MKKRERSMTLEKLFKDFVDEKEIIGSSLLRNDGEVIASYHLKVPEIIPNLIAPEIIPNLIARESLSAKRRRTDKFPVLGKLITNIGKYEKMYIGLSSVDKNHYVVVLAKSKIPLTEFSLKLEKISKKINLSKIV